MFGRNIMGWFNFRKSKARKCQFMPLNTMKFFNKLTSLCKQLYKISNVKWYGSRKNSYPRGRGISKAIDSTWSTVNQHLNQYVINTRPTLNWHLDWHLIDTQSIVGQMLTVTHQIHMSTKIWMLRTKEFGICCLFH